MAIEPAALAKGIASRLERLAEKFAPGRAAEVAAAGQRLRIEPASEPGRDAWLIGYDEQRALHLEQWGAKDSATQVRELLDDLEDRGEPGARKVREVLHRTLTMAAIDLKVPDEGVGVAVAVAAAAALAEQGHGLVQADGHGWFAPADGDVEQVLAE